MAKRSREQRVRFLKEFDEAPDWARFDEAVIAAVQNCSVAKLQRDRWAGEGIPFVREGGKLVTNRNGQQQVYGGRIFYIKRDVVAALEARNQVVSSTTQTTFQLREQAAHPLKPSASLSASHALLDEDEKHASLKSPIQNPHAEPEA